MSEIPKDATVGECYYPAMAIMEQAEADSYFEALVRRNMQWGHTQAEAERIERSNLGYFAGYYDSATRERVERLFHCVHPIFGAIAERGEPTSQDAFEAGVRWAKGGQP